MIKTMCRLFLFLIFFSQPLMAESSLEIRSAAFFHSSDRFRKIYGDVNACYGVEGTTSLCASLDAWTNFDWLSRHGKSDGLSDPTRVSIANFSFGIKYPYPFCDRFIAYMGIGPSFSGIWLKNKPRHHQQNASKLAVGGVLKSGIYYFINSCVFIDLFVDYLYQPVYFEKRSDIGGIKTGAGLGFKF